MCKYFVAFWESSVSISSQARETILHTYSKRFSLSSPSTKEEKRKLKEQREKKGQKIYLLEISWSRCSLTCAVTWDGRKGNMEDTKIPFPLHELGSGWISCCFCCPLSHFSNYFDVRWCSKTVVWIVDKLVFSVNMFGGDVILFLKFWLLLFSWSHCSTMRELLFSQHVPANNCHC